MTIFRTGGPAPGREPWAHAARARAGAEVEGHHQELHGRPSDWWAELIFCGVESCTFSISGKTNQETIDDDDDDDDEDDQDNDDNDESSGDEEDAEMDMNFGIQGRDA